MYYILFISNWSYLGRYKVGRIEQIETSDQAKARGAAGVSILWARDSWTFDPVIHFFHLILCYMDIIFNDLSDKCALGTLEIFFFFY